MLGEQLVLVTLYRGLQSVLSKTIIIGDTKYHIQCRQCLFLKKKVMIIFKERERKTLKL